MHVFSLRANFHNCRPTGTTYRGVDGGEFHTKCSFDLEGCFFCAPRDPKSGYLILISDRQIN